MCGTIPPFPLYTFTSCTGTTFHFATNAIKCYTVIASIVNVRCHIYLYTFPHCISFPFQFEKDLFLLFSHTFIISLPLLFKSLLLLWALNISKFNLCFWILGIAANIIIFLLRFIFEIRVSKLHSCTSLI
jgi:hypothetical protein